MPSGSTTALRRQRAVGRAQRRLRRVGVAQRDVGGLQHALVGQRRRGGRRSRCPVARPCTPSPPIRSDAAAAAASSGHRDAALGERAASGTTVPSPRGRSRRIGGAVSSRASAMRSHRPSGASPPLLPSSAATPRGRAPRPGSAGSPRGAPRPAPARRGRRRRARRRRGAPRPRRASCSLTGHLPARRRRARCAVAAGRTGSGSSPCPRAGRAGPPPHGRCGRRSRPGRSPAARPRAASASASCTCSATARSTTSCSRS